MTESRFRILIWTGVALTVAAIVAAVFPDYSESLASAYENEPQTWIMSSVWLSGSLAIAIFGAWLIGSIGMHFFKGWARALSLYATFAGLVISPSFGATVSSGLESALFEASSVVWGSVLALAYFSPVSARFGR